uniref:Uncharacterized protein n=1 Tax=Pseudomonas aeruginosa TaxID=287 RepID=A0A7G8A9E2_PSEAI|nr:Hypothetical protein [Pseudomonas aeruginosa]QNI17056.1 Hypothetical protein [Pseudomonas sp.]
MLHLASTKIFQALQMNSANQATTAGEDHLDLFRSAVPI